MPPTPTLRQVLIIQTAFLGDVVLATALIEAIKQQYPEVAIDFVLRRGNEGLLARHPHIRRLIVWDKSKQKWANLLKTIQVIRQQKYDAVFNVQRFLSTGIMTLLARSRQSIGFDKNPLSWAFSQVVAHEQVGKHEVERNLALLQTFVPTLQHKPKLYLSPQDTAAVGTYQKQPYICIAPTSVWHTKQFPTEQWINFIKKLQATAGKKEWYIYLLGSPQDATVCEQIRTAEGINTQFVHTLAGKLSLLESAALMQKAIMNYANDSAPVHLASALDAPICAIYCSTIPAFGFYPLSSKSYVIETTEPLACRPCGLHGHKSCPAKHFACAYSIDLNRLVACLDS